VAGPSSSHVTSADIGRFLMIVMIVIRDKRVLVTTACHVVRSQMEEWLPIRKVAMNMLNKQLWTADKWWSSSLGVG